MTQITITDENDNPRQVWVAQTVADKELKTIGTDGKDVIVASPGDHGGYVEVLCDENGEPIKNPDGTLPLPVPPGEDGVDNGRGGLKGLSQNDMSWTQPGTYLVGNAGITRDAQFVGPDAIISGADQITGEVGIGGSGFRSSGESQFDGNGSYIDMQMDPGAQYTFTGGTQIGGPAHFEAGEGLFCDADDGRITMMFAAREGSKLQVKTSEGFQSNGLAALDDCSIGGSFTGNPDMVMQDSMVATDADFSGPVTIVNQEVGEASYGMKISGDADLDAIALTVGPKDAATAGYNTFGDFDSQEDYWAHVSDVLTHEMGENYGDTSSQHHYDDVHAQMNNDLEDKWRQIQEVDPTMSREDFDKLYRNLSGYQDGINDAIVEDIVEVRTAGGDKAVSGLLDDLVGEDEELRAQILEGGDEAVQAYLDENGVEANVAETREAGAKAALEEFQATSEAAAWDQGSARRHDAQSQEMVDRTSGTSQWTLGNSVFKKGDLNEKAAGGLHASPEWQSFSQEAPQAMPDASSELTVAPADEKPKDWRLTLANKLPAGTPSADQKDSDGMEYDG